MSFVQFYGFLSFFGSTSKDLKSCPGRLIFHTLSCFSPTGNMPCFWTIPPPAVWSIICRWLVTGKLWGFLTSWCFETKNKKLLLYLCFCFSFPKPVANTRAFFNNVCYRHGPGKESVTFRETFNNILYNRHKTPTKTAKHKLANIENHKHSLLQIPPGSILWNIFIAKNGTWWTSPKHPENRTWLRQPMRKLPDFPDFRGDLGVTLL